MAAASAPDRGYDCTFGPPCNVRGEPGLADSLNDVFNLFWSGAVRHVYDHGKYPFASVYKSKRRDRRSRRLVCNSELFLFTKPAPVSHLRRASKPVAAKSASAAKTIHHHEFL